MVRDLHSGAATTSTQVLGLYSIPLRRANIQGDSLLPLLILPLLQPLLHRLYVSDRGYWCASLPCNAPHLANALAASNENAVLSGFPEQLQVRLYTKQTLQTGQASGSHHLEVWHQAQSSCKQANCAVHWERSSGLLAVLTV